jgi:hypothetical protein
MKFGFDEKKAKEYVAKRKTKEALLEVIEISKLDQADYAIGILFFEVASTFPDSL